MDFTRRLAPALRTVTVRTITRVAELTSVCALVCCAQADAAILGGSASSVGASRQSPSTHVGVAPGGGCASALARARPLRTRTDGRVTVGRDGDEIALVVHQVGRDARRVATFGRGSCHVDPVRLQRRLHGAGQVLRARVSGPTGSWEFRIASVHYDRTSRALSLRGHLEDHEGPGLTRGQSAGARNEAVAIAADCPAGPSCSSTTEIVYASTFIPFDSSF